METYGRFVSAGAGGALGGVHIPADENRHRGPVREGARCRAGDRLRQWRRARGRRIPDHGPWSLRIRRRVPFIVGTGGMGATTMPRPFRCGTVRRQPNPGAEPRPHVASLATMIAANEAW